jgi:hypothetical protein
MRVQCRQDMPWSSTMELLVKGLRSALIGAFLAGCAGTTGASFLDKADAKGRPVARATSSGSNCFTEALSVHRATASMGSWAKSVRGAPRGRVHSSVECPVRRAAVAAGPSRTRVSSPGSPLVRAREPQLQERGQPSSKG